MADLGGLVDFYNQASQYVSQHKETIGAVNALVVLPVLLAGYTLKPVLDNYIRFKRNAVSQLEALSVPAVLDIPTFKIPNPYRGAEVALYINSGGQQGSTQRVPTMHHESRVKRYASRVRNGEDGLFVLHEALRDIEIRILFTQK